MRVDLARFEQIVRGTKSVGATKEPSSTSAHPFDLRNIHPAIASVSMKLFDDGHYAQATFEALKFLDVQVSTISGIGESGYKLMMAAFNENNPSIRLNGLANRSEVDEQMGFRYIFAGLMSGVRNPRGHDIRADPVDTCLDHLSMASVLLRILDSRQHPPP